MLYCDLGDVDTSVKPKQYLTSPRHLSTSPVTEHEIDRISKDIREQVKIDLSGVDISDSSSEGGRAEGGAVRSREGGARRNRECWDRSEELQAMIAEQGKEVFVLYD